MKIVVICIIFLLLIFTSACNKKDQNISIIEEKELDLQMIDAYEAGLFELDIGDAISAANKFNEAELLFPQSKWAPRASLKSAYAYYSQNYYENAVYEIKRYFKTYPNHNRKDYAYYLLAICYYDQIVDEQKDLGPIIDAKKNFQHIVKNYPNSDFALDSEYKLELIEEILAAKEMYLARYYIDREKWVAAINRYKIVLENYGTSIYVEEAIHRLVEIHYKLGLIEESKKYASLLGYNYQSSEWYEKSYKVFNKNYKKISKSKKGKNKISTLEKIKSLLK